MARPIYGTYRYHLMLSLGENIWNSGWLLLLVGVKDTASWIPKLYSNSFLLSHSGMTQAVREMQRLLHMVLSFVKNASTEQIFAGHNRASGQIYVGMVKSQWKSYILTLPKVEECFKYVSLSCKDLFQREGTASLQRILSREKTKFKQRKTSQKSSRKKKRNDRNFTLSFKERWRCRKPYKRYFLQFPSPLQLKALSAKQEAHRSCWAHTGALNS